MVETVALLGAGQRFRIFAEVGLIRLAGMMLRANGVGVAERAGELSQRTSRKARQVTNQVTEKVNSFVSEQPLLVAAVGLAVGAILAASLPSTETEDALMGQASDAVKEKLGDVASEKYESAKAAAGKIALEAQAEAARGLGEKVKRVITETAATAESEARDLAGLDKQS